MMRPLVVSNYSSASPIWTSNCENSPNFDNFYKKGNLRSKKMGMQTKDLDKFKLYTADTGLFISLMFDNSKQTNEIYKKLLSDKLNADLGYLYENVAAQIIAASDRELYYHTWQKENSTHYYEIDFLLSHGHKVVPVEIKSSAARNHESIDQFAEKYSRKIHRRILFSQKDVDHIGTLQLKPLYMLPFAIEEI